MDCATIELANSEYSSEERYVTVQKYTYLKLYKMEITLKWEIILFSVRQFTLSSPLKKNMI